eukprot:CAMPEP_0174375094 /NCGR_PEP_ID=MMETSP0811_2-20130205/113303_1 /TAXON_ID=73025 ORGANISM="Eutreptiella gymnastica-like, Strain CCMP1594" /NCGR_SAMPLE_ID=MMETSP0811_2 /ASSEMBLY_ACC=CAM_ASM_000667 /LENGTH=38 /DNA_ID= /DNA_START= /DNA_END= /DNA_ORIENTATION=
MELCPWNTTHAPCSNCPFAPPRNFWTCDSKVHSLSPAG